MFAAPASCSRGMKTVLAVLVLGMTGAPVYAQESGRGRLHIIWDVAESAAQTSEYYLVDTIGRSTRLLPDTGPLAGGSLELDRRTVDVRFADRIDGAIPTARLLDVKLVQSSDGRYRAAGAVHGQYDFVTLLCQFSDDTTLPVSRADVERAHGATYPGVQNFFAELSWDGGIMSRSRVTGWYKLARPRSAYVTDNGTDFGALARDCTSAADVDVHFPDFFGINLQFSSGLSIRGTPPHDTLSFGGSWSLTLDGLSRTWGMTWLSGGHANNYVVLTHEIGHAIGWPHSSGDYGNDYDSSWDVMSRGYLRWEPPYGWLGVHTIAHHKDAAGWVPDARRWVPPAGIMESGTLTRTALPSDGYLLARVPAAGNSYYTIEARRVAGQDRPLPADAVVLHHVTQGRARVVDVDNDGDPNDSGAQWIPGETFQDSISGVTVVVDSASAAGFHVGITRGWRLDLYVRGMGHIRGARLAVSTPTDSIRCESTCTTVMKERGTEVALSAVPAAGWRFVEWRGACSGASECSSTLKGNRQIDAVFAPTVVVQTEGVSPAIVGAEYRDTLRVDGAQDVETWIVAGGMLPPGLRLDAPTGVVSGVPTEPGRFTLTIAARVGATQVQTALSIVVSEPVLGMQQVVDHLFGGSSLSTAEVRFLDLIGNGNGIVDIGDVRRWLINARHLTETERSSAEVIVGTGGRLE